MALPLRLLAPLAALVVVGCGDDERVRPAGGARGLTQAIGLTRAAGEVPLHYEERLTRGTQPATVDVTAEGSVDLAADSGEARVEFHGIATPGLPASWDLRWDAHSVTAAGKTLPRAQARETGGMLGLLPDHIHALAEMPLSGVAVTQTAPGSWTFEVATADLARAGAAFLKGQPPRLRAEAQAADDGSIHRIELSIRHRGFEVAGRRLDPGVLTWTVTLGD